MTGFASVGVVGAGLIGGSVARRLQSLGVDVVVADPDAETCAAAARAGLAVGDAYAAELVVLATPLDALPAVMREAAAGPARVVVDLGSVKGAPAVAAREAGLAGRYVGLHPMGGTELSGFAAASADLLAGATWAAARPDPAAGSLLAPVVAWVVASFAAEVVVLEAEEHDRAVAWISHLPHVVANALLGLVESTAPPAAAVLAAGSFRDGTRVAGRNARRTANMLGENAPALTASVDALLEALHAYRDDLADPGRLLARLEAVSAGAASARTPEPTWRACPDLAEALAGSGGVMVRAVDGSFQVAPIASPAG